MALRDEWGMVGLFGTQVLFTMVEAIWQLIDVVYYQNNASITS